MIRRVLIAAAALALVWSGLAPRAAAVPAAVRPSFGLEERVYPATSADGGVVPVRWRVVEGTGNCCEHFVTTTADGKIVDFGGTWPFVSTDDGVRWHRIDPTTPVRNGEGAGAVAPNGDILGVIWDLYTGDHAIAYRWTAATGAWDFLEIPAHTPFWDRPWFSVVPGPFKAGNLTVPYIAIVESGFPVKRPLLMSLDGLTYVAPTAELVGVLSAADEPSPFGPAPYADYVQPNWNSSIIPVVGGALAPAVSPDAGCHWTLMRLVPAWRCLGRFIPPPHDRLAMDSAGHLHAIKLEGPRFAYWHSTDGGATWEGQRFDVPDNQWVSDTLETDFKVNAAAGVAALALHVGRRADYVFKFHLGADGPTLDKLMTLGKADWTFGNSFAVINPQPRYDFPTVAILPDGRIVASFADSEHLYPALAIELPS